MTRRRTEVPFAQFEARPRFQSHQACKDLEQFQSPLLSWLARARVARLAEPPKRKKESWRLDTPIAAASIASKASDDKKPYVRPPFDPDLMPTRDRIIFPWEAEMTPIEWAVRYWLTKEHPEITERLIHVACVKYDLKDDDGSIPIPKGDGPNKRQ